MKFICLSIFLNTLYLSSLTCQTWHKPSQPVSSPCLSGGVSFTTQHEIDQFSSLYPNCTEIDGTVLIIESANNSITSLLGLNQLTSINGDLRIANNSSLASLAGLENIEAIKGSLLLFENDVLSSLAGLHGVKTLSGFLSIGKNDRLEDLAGLDNIFFGITDLRLFANPLLSTCELPNICRYLSNGGIHTINGNAEGCASSSQISSICLSADPCAKDFLLINFDPIFSGTYQAIQELESTGSVSFGANVSFKASNCIVLNGGFSVSRHAQFEADIENCGL